MFYPSGRNSKTGSIPNKKRRILGVYSSTIQETTISASQEITVPAKIRIMNTDSINGGRFVYPLPQNTPANLWSRYQEIEALAEAIIGRRSCTTSSIHEKFRATASVPAFTSVSVHTAGGALPLHPKEFIVERTTIDHSSSWPIYLNIIMRKPCVPRTMFV